MHKDKHVFAQLAQFHDNDKFRHIVDKAIMKNYGVAPGSSANVYQLLFERNSQLEYYDTPQLYNYL